MKTLLGTTINEDVRGILYICEYDYATKTIKPIKDLLFEEAWVALDRYAETPNPESQLVTGRSYFDLITKLDILHKSMSDPLWQEELSNYL